MKIEDLICTVDKIYGVQDDRLYDLEDHFYYERKFLLRYTQSAKKEYKMQNLVISLAWFLGAMKRFHIDLDKELFKRYPYKCPFCLGLPCVCESAETQDKKTQKVGRPTSRPPKTINDWQNLALKIYPNDNLQLINKELFFAQDKSHYLFRSFRRTLGKTKIKEIANGAADYFMIILRLFNLLGKDLSREFKYYFGKGCYICHKSPCQCYYFE